MEDYQTLTKWQKMKKVLPKVLPLLLLSVILPSADIWTDVVLIEKLYEGLFFCTKSDGMDRIQMDYWKCEYRGPYKYCLNSNSSVCGMRSDGSQYCRDYKMWSDDWKAFDQCKDQGGDKYCSDGKNNKNVCGGSHPLTASSLLFRSQRDGSSKRTGKVWL